MKELQVSVKAVILNSKDQILILKNNPLLYPETQKWSIPGGRIELEVDLKTNLLREVFEETGLTEEDVSIEKLITAIDIIKGDKHVVRLTYLCKLKSDDLEIKLSEEHEKFRFVTIEELRKVDPLDSYVFRIIDEIEEVI